jgi:hypothetical protein
MKHFIINPFIMPPLTGLDILCFHYATNISPLTRLKTSTVGTKYW